MSTNLRRNVWYIEMAEYYYIIEGKETPLRGEEKVAFEAYLTGIDDHSVVRIGNVVLTFGLNTVNPTTFYIMLRDGVRRQLFPRLL